MATNPIINSNVVFVNENSIITDAVKIMIDKNISSVLAHDDEGQVTGIITEKDIVQKFTLLDVKDKLTRPVNTFMTRPVIFVELKNMDEGIIKLHLEKRIRHFPVINDPIAHMSNVVGIVSITDLLKKYLRNGAIKAQTSQPTTIQRPLAVIAASQNIFNQYYNIFTPLAFKVTRITDFGEFMKSKPQENPPIIFDMDGFDENAVKFFTPITRKYPGTVITATSNYQVHSVLSKFSTHEQHHIAIKPLDISYINWIFDI